MDDVLIFEGKNIEEILEQALNEFDCESTDELEYEVLEEGEKRNLLFKKAQFIKAEVRKKSVGPSNLDRDLKVFLETILQMTDLSKDVEVDFDGEQFHINILGLKLDDLQEGKEVLDSLQHLVSRFLYRKGAPHKILVDASGLRQQRLEELEEMIQRIHDYVMTGKTTTTAPLSASERRHVHMSLDEMGGARTLSIGRGPKKRIRIFPSNKFNRSAHDYGVSSY